MGRVKYQGADLYFDWLSKADHEGNLLMKKGIRSGFAVLSALTMMDVFLTFLSIFKMLS
jgi:hypothetical protein